jgi:hypothetical protein
MTPNSEQLYQIEHFTAYHYSEPVMLSHQQLHLTPRPLEHQQVIKHAVAITPTPTLRREFIDAFGNPVTEVAIESAHTALNIAAYTTVKLAAARRGVTIPNLGECSRRARLPSRVALNHHIGSDSVSFRIAAHQG